MEHILLRKFYKEVLLSMKQNSVHGKSSIAKPILVLSIFEGMENHIVEDNKIYAETLLPLFEKRCLSYGGGHIPFYYYPFYFLASDGFYHLKWKGAEIKTTSPTAKFIREHVEYAYLDDELWELLQDKAVRDEYTEAIIKRYLTNK